MKVDRTPNALCMYIPAKHWTKVVEKISHLVPVGVGIKKGSDRILCLPAETTDEQVIELMTEAGFLKG